jgi:cytochrome c
MNPRNREVSLTGASMAWLAALLLASCSSSDKALGLWPRGEGRLEPSVQERGHDPWIFRSVLDQQPRMLTLALGKGLWAAYDATTCTLYKAWTGGVNFDGPVYTTVHGPQPTTEGEDLLDPLAGSHWQIVFGDTRVIVQPRWMGYRLVGNRAHLEYALPLPNGNEIGVVETPELVTDGAGAMGLLRVFRLSDVPPGARVFLRANERPPGALAHEITTDALFDGLVVVDMAATGEDTERSAATWLRLNSDTHTTLAVVYNRKAPLPLGDDEAPADNDHGTTPSAGKADSTAAWDRPRAKVRSLDPSVAAGVREPGLAARFYLVEGGMSKLMPLVPGQTPNISVVLPDVDLDGAVGGFGELSDTETDPRFVTHLSGFLSIDPPGRYGFRLQSDDGARLRIGGQLVVDHDGLHADEPLDDEVELQTGVHELYIEHFENGGCEGLHLFWRMPDSKEFVLVPPEVLSCQAGEVRVTSPGPKKLVRPLQRGSPGDGMPLEDVHPSYDLATVRPAGFEPKVAGLAFLSDGRLAVSTWDADGAVYFLDGVQGNDPEAVTVHKFASGLAEPLGLCVVRDRIFVLQKQELTELIDHDGDDVADEYRTIAGGWPVTANFHEFAFGLVYEGGYFYANLAVAINSGGASTQPQIEGRGSVLRIGMDGSTTTVAHGLRTPNGIGRGVGGALYITDNQGDWLPVSKLLRLQRGAFYGSQSVLGGEAADLPVTPPVVWLPQGEIGNSPSQPAPLEDGPYAGQMIHGEVTHGGIKRVFVEEIDGVAQGAVFRFIQGLEAGINRLVWGPDGALYMGGIGSTGNWGQTGKQHFGLQRVLYNGKPTFEMLAVRARTNGFEIEFTEPLAHGSGWEPEDYFVESWTYEATEDYGGPKLDLRAEDVLSASVQPQGRRVFLELGQMEAGRVYHLRLFDAITSASARPLWTTETWYTLNVVPPGHPGRTEPNPPRRPDNVLSRSEQAAGWAPLFDGGTTAGWRGFKQDTMPDGWEVIDGALTLTGSGGDIITEGQYDDFELQLEWKLEPGGNSGIFFHVTEDAYAVWSTGPEMQVLDNVLHHDGQDPRTSAGANYALHAPTRDVSRPPGRWNKVRLLVQGHHVEHWLNGHKLLEYEMYSDDWQDRVEASKFRDFPDYGKRTKGHIALQDHGDRVSYRNIRIRDLLPE